MIDETFEMRLAAFHHIQELNRIYPHMTDKELKRGFDFEGNRYPLINPQRGIFKPKQMKHLLSIRTVFPRPGGRVWYDDQRVVHQQIYTENESINYAFMGHNPDAADNRWLKSAMENKVPIIYFLGIAPGCYRAIIPTFIVDWDPKALQARIAFGNVDQMVLDRPESSGERRYAMYLVKQRLHQDSFREAVIYAYSGRCSVSGLREVHLLDAAHIVPDKDKELGQPIVPNGISLSKIHHAAYDAHLIGIDPDYKIHVSGKLLSQKDGPMLEALKKLDGQPIHLPVRPKDYPDKDRLAIHYEKFVVAA